MDKNNIEILKNVFAHSSEYIIFTDFDFNVIWYNNPELASLVESENIKALFEGESLPLSSGEYFVKRDGLTFSCKVINYPDTQNGLYVLQMSRDDAVFSFIRCKTVQEFLMNQAGAIRQAVTGISVSSNILHKSLDDADLYSEQKYIDITMGNCYKLLKSILNTTELIRYTDGSIEIKRVDVFAIISEFINICQEILGNQIEIRYDCQKNLFIDTDPERFTYCLLSLLILANGKTPENNILILSAERIGDWISVTVSADSSENVNKNRIFSRFDALYKGEEVNSDLFVVNRFCKEFGGMLLIAGDSGESRTYSIKLPCSNELENTISFDSSIRPYPSDKFSKYHIALSDIADVFYF